MQLCNKLKDNGETLMRKPEGFTRGTFIATMLAIAILATVALGGCARAGARPLIDRAFALIYPELSARILKEFGDGQRGRGPEDKYLPLPFSSSPPNINSKEIYIASPAIAAAIESQIGQTGARVVSLLGDASALPSVDWDSAWAYRQMGLIAGYRAAAIRTSSPPDSRASILFSRGIGRTDAELEAFERGFDEGARAAGIQNSVIDSAEAPGNAEPGAPKSRFLKVFDVDSMGLHGDRLEQTLAACAQMLQSSPGPSVIVVAAGSLGALEKTLQTQGEVIADMRGLGQGISQKRLLAAVGENIGALVEATGQLVRELHEGKPAPKVTLVRPTLYLAGEARRALKAAQP